MPSSEWLAYTIERHNRPSELFGIQKALDSVIPEIWHHCDLATKQAIARQLGDLPRIQWPMASYSAEMLVRHLRGGQLEVRACVEELRWAGQNFVVEVKHGHLLHGDWFINATGIGWGPARRFYVSVHAPNADARLGGATSGVGRVLGFLTGRLLNRRGGPAGPIWSGASALTRGTRLLTSELGEATPVRCDGQFDTA